MSKRPTERTPEKDARFLDELAKGLSVTGAANAAGYHRQRVYEIRKDDSEFAEKWDAAIDQGTDVLEDEMRRRAYEGVDEPVFHQGRQCGVIRKYSDTLLIFSLKGRRPQKYRDNVDLNHSGNMAVTVMNYGGGDDLK